MKITGLVISLLLLLGLTSCQTMNSNFSCNATAGDSCLTIEQVDAMTRFADDEQSPYVPRKNVMKAQNQQTSPQFAAKKSQNNKIWVSPEVAKAKHWKPASTYVNADSKTNREG